MLAACIYRKFSIARSRRHRDFLDNNTGMLGVGISHILLWWIRQVGKVIAHKLRIAHKETLPCFLKVTACAHTPLSPTKSRIAAECTRERSNRVQLFKMSKHDRGSDKPPRKHEITDINRGVNNQCIGNNNDIGVRLHLCQLIIGLIAKEILKHNRSRRIFLEIIVIFAKINLRSGSKCRRKKNRKQEQKSAWVKSHRQKNL